MNIAIPLLSYLAGCVCTGYYLVRLCTGKDIRALGSGSVGAKNAGRILGKWAFVVTMAGDALKGAVVVWLARYFTGDARLELLAGAGAIIGHVWPVQLRFQGGKGLSTVLGALLVFDIIGAMAYGVLAAIACAALRNVVLGGLLAVAVMPAVFIVRGSDAFIIVGAAVVVTLILFAHRKNIAAELAVLRGRCQHRDTKKPDCDDE
ncbi:MAG: glycerol-3-phosphate acyltransferase [Verrucomicrobiaceae bacterium]